MATRIEPVHGILKVKAAATGNLTLSGAQTIDGVSCVAGDLVLAHQQSTGAEKAVYQVAASAWTLVDPGPSDGLEIAVLQGSTLGDHKFKVTTSSVWGTDTPTFADQGAGGGGGMVTLTGTEELTNKTLTAMVVKTGLTASGSAANDFSASTGTFKTSTGINTIGGRLAAGATAFNIPDPGNAGAIPVTTSGVCNLTSAGAETRTVAAPTFEGQRLTLCCNVDGGDNVVTFASAFNQAGNTVATFNDAGDTLNVIGARIASALRWRIVNNDGCTLS